MPFAFWTFITSLVLLAGMSGIRAFELSSGQKLLEVSFVRKTDIFVHHFFHLIKRQISRISIKGTWKLIYKLSVQTKDWLVNFKKKYDSRQPKFFVKQTKNDITQKGSVSFFLKNVSDYKESIRNK